MTVHSISAPMDMAASRSTGGALRSLVFGLIAFLTLVDLFATQAILPSLARTYQVSAAAMGVAVNASTAGMAISGLAVGLFSRRINRRQGVLMSLALLSLPTALLAVAPDLVTFTALRVVQGVFMAAAFTLTLAYLGEQCSAKEASGALAAYITGNVASNLIGRLVAAGVTEHLGLAVNFYAFAVLNLSGTAVAFFALSRSMPVAPETVAARGPLAAWAGHLCNGPLRAAFAIGFLILFAFIGTFTYVNFVLVDDPIALSPMTLGYVYFAFLPSILTTPLAGRAAHRFGTRRTMWAAFAVAALGLPLVLLPSGIAVIAGLVLIGAGTFFAQAVATGFVSRAATLDRGAASGIYLAGYFLGGIVGSILLGQIFDRVGWAACVAGIGCALALAALLAARLKKHRVDR